MTDANTSNLDANTSSTLTVSSSGSPIKPQPLHDPARAAMVVGQKAPLGSTNRTSTTHHAW